MQILFVKDLIFDLSTVTHCTTCSILRLLGSIYLILIHTENIDSPLGWGLKNCLLNVLKHFELYSLFLSIFRFVSGTSIVSQMKLLEAPMGF